ncbi:hypothetical protein IWZ03DRAFT_232222 [Phyllosticta citriasiana]|uniref:Secreted protein n=1 Tax=Phyllosticta citriasiana TaxID=595635 RepID=A0ABR1KJ49_9PEZI
MRLLILSVLEFLGFFFFVFSTGHLPAMLLRSLDHGSDSNLSCPAANDGIFSCYKVGCISLLHTSTRIVFFSRACYFGGTRPVTAAQARLVFMLLTEEMAKNKRRETKKKKKKKKKGTREKAGRRRLCCSVMEWRGRHAWSFRTGPVANSRLG